MDSTVNMSILRQYCATGQVTWHTSDCSISTHTAHQHTHCTSTHCTSAHTLHISTHTAHQHTTHQHTQCTSAHTAHQHTARIIINNVLLVRCHRRPNRRQSTLSHLSVSPPDAWHQFYRFIPGAPQQTVRDKGVRVVEVRSRVFLTSALGIGYLSASRPGRLTLTILVALYTATMFEQRETSKHLNF
jgi:hypothetical protein